MKEEDIDYIAGYYRAGLFSTKNGWRRLGITPLTGWKRLKIAAAIALCFAFSVTASVLDFTQTHTEKEPEHKESFTSDQKKIARIIDFENTPLPEVIRKIKDIYGVEISNIPENAEEIHLSLHYEGTALDLISAINEILDTNMEVKE